MTGQPDQMRDDGSGALAGAVAGIRRSLPLWYPFAAPPSKETTKDTLEVPPPDIGQAKILRPFLIEASVAAGPRKSPADYEEPQWREFGEDAFGLARVGERSIFWLADGTSDCLSLFHSDQAFTTRKLARDLGDAFCAAAVRCDRLRAEDMQSLVLDRVARDWQRRLSDVLARVGAQGKLDEFVRALPEIPGGRHQILWSSTLIGGVFHETSGVLEAWNCGDSGALIAANPVGLIEPRRKRIFLVATLATQSGEASVAVEAVGAKDCPVLNYEGVTGFIAMTDGLVDQDLGNFLQELKESLAHRSLAEIGTALRAGTDRSHDDKAIVLARYLADDEA